MLDLCLCLCTGKIPPEFEIILDTVLQKTLLENDEITVIRGGFLFITSLLLQAND
jgi:hypothetical protein